MERDADDKGLTRVYENLDFPVPFIAKHDKGKSTSHSSDGSKVNPGQLLQQELDLKLHSSPKAGTSGALPAATRLPRTQLAVSLPESAADTIVKKPESQNTAQTRDSNSSEPSRKPILNDSDANVLAKPKPVKHGKPSGLQQDKTRHAYQNLNFSVVCIPRPSVNEAGKKTPGFDGPGAGTHLKKQEDKNAVSVTPQVHEVGTLKPTAEPGKTIAGLNTGVAVADWADGSAISLGLYEFKGAEDGDLSFQAGELIKLVRKTKDKNWLEAKNEKGELGVIPNNYVTHQRGVKLQPLSWCHGKLSRSEVSKLLQPERDGKFLVRESNNFENDFSISVCCEETDTIEHYHVQHTRSGRSIDQNTFFPTVLELIEVIQGQFGVLPVCVKRPSDRCLSEDFYMEAAILTILRHPNVVRLWGVVRTPDVDKTLVLEHMPGGTLHNRLTSEDSISITGQDQLTFLLEICRGMCHLGTKSIVHRSLASCNILLAQTGRAKISNFGCARLVKSKNKAPDELMIRWTDPHALKRKGWFTHQSDMWSFGVLLWEIYNYGKVPYENIPEDTLLSFLETGYRLENEIAVPKEIGKILKQAHDYEPSGRPSFAETLTILERMVK